VNRIQLTEADRKILQELSRDGRLSNKDLAERVGLPRSTCHGRVRALEEAGAIRGYRADIDPEAAGAGVEAMIFVGVLSHVRNRLPLIAARLRSAPGVQHVFVIGGDHDFVLHVACRSVPALRDFISLHLGSDPDLGPTRTQIIFEHHAGSSPVPAP